MPEVRPSENGQLVAGRPEERRAYVTCSMRMLAFTIARAVTYASATSLLRQVLHANDKARIDDNSTADRYHRDQSLVFVDANMTYLTDIVDADVATIEDAKNVSNMVAEGALVSKRSTWLFRIRFDGGMTSQNPKAQMRPYRVGLHGKPVVDPLCAFLSRIGPALAAAGPHHQQFALLSVGTHGLGSPFHPSMRKQFRESQECANLSIQSVEALQTYLLAYDALKAWFVSQHWPTTLDAPWCPSTYLINAWDPGKDAWDLDWSRGIGCTHEDDKLVLVPLGLPGTSLGKSIAFDHVFVALQRAVLRGESTTIVRPPGGVPRKLTFRIQGDDVMRTKLVSSAMKLHKGRDRKLDGLSTGLGVSVPNEATVDPPLRRQTYSDVVDFYLALAQSIFVFSPVGTGLDCYRHWESMALGAIPIVDYSPTNARLFRNLPVLLVDDFLLTPLYAGALEEWYRDRIVSGQKKFFDLAKLTKRYWRLAIQHVLDDDHQSLRYNSTYISAPVERALSRPPEPCLGAPFLALCLDNWVSPDRLSAEPLASSAFFLTPRHSSSSNFSHSLQCKHPAILDNVDVLTTLFEQSGKPAEREAWQRHLARAPSRMRVRQ